ncbi:MAG: NRDE family protein [Planctomycetes bacterium]|nr:NRDE family protein [Planctomycetota bacterium]
MCFLVLHHRVHQAAPVVLLATRDERYDRAFDLPHRWEDAPGVFAPRDREAGGTWIGTNEDGLLVAITNRGRPHPELQGRSRGLLVRDMLGHARAREALETLAALVEAHASEGFHLLLADRDHAFAIRREALPRGTALAPADVFTWAEGSHTLSSLHEPDEARVPHELLPPDVDLASWMARHEVVSADASPRLPGGVPILKHSADGRRGTVCAALVTLPDDAQAAAGWRFAAGSPATVPYVDLNVR